MVRSYIEELQDKYNREINLQIVKRFWDFVFSDKDVLDNICYFNDNDRITIVKNKLAERFQIDPSMLELPSYLHANTHLGIEALKEYFTPITKKEFSKVRPLFEQKYALNRLSVFEYTRYKFYDIDPIPVAGFRPIMLDKMYIVGFFSLNQITNEVVVFSLQKQHFELGSSVYIKNDIVLIQQKMMQCLQLQVDKESFINHWLSLF